MAKFVCVCGEVIRTSGLLPNPQEYRVLSDVDFDRFEGTVEAEEVYVAATVAYRCPRSDHLWIYWDGLDADPSLYSPEGVQEGHTGPPRDEVTTTG